MLNEKQIALAAKMYQARATIRTLWGDDYAERIKEYCDVIRSAQQQDDLSEIDAAMFLIAELHAAMPGNEMSQMAVLAAAVEMVEPSEAPDAN